MFQEQPNQPVVGILLAAGAGRRMGRPKALIRHDDGSPWVRTAHDALVVGGCHDVVTVLGARAEQARTLLEGRWTVVASDWERGMSASLACGLTVVQKKYSDAVAVVIHLVDIPDIGSDVVSRLLERLNADVIARAAYGDQFGHPVLIGRNHFTDLSASLDGDAGARDFLAAHQVDLVECSDLADGADVDHF